MGETGTPPMLPEQIPGSLFVLGMFTLAVLLGAYPAAFLLALGCAAGWLSFDYRPPVASLGGILAFTLWTAGTIWLFIRMIF